MKLKKKIDLLVTSGKLEWKKHVLQRMFERVISRAEVKQTEGKCPLCLGHKHKSTTTFTVDLKFGVVVIRDVPALVCEQCGEEWIADKEAEELESIVNVARQKHSMIEVANYSDLLKVSS